MIFTNSQPEYSILDLGFDKTLTKALLSLQGDVSTPELSNVFTSGVAPRTLIAGELIAVLEQQAGAVFSGKTAFDNAQAGYRLGIDASDNLVKFYIGDSSNYLNWTGSILSVSGVLSAGSIDIGGSDATSFHVDVDGNMWLGAATFASGPFRVTSSGAMTAESGTFTSGTITGGTIRTAASGARIELTSANGVAVYNSDGTLIGQFQTTDSGTLFSSTSPNTAGRMFQHISFIQSGSNANPMVYLQAEDVSTGTTCLSIVQKGDLNAILVSQTATSNSNSLQMENLGTGLVAYLKSNNAGSVRAVEIYNIGSGEALYAGQSGNSAIAPVEFNQATAASTNFYKVIKLNGAGTNRAVWLSNGTTPNGNLTGVQGDICINADGGKAYYCSTTGTTWTAM